MAKPVSNLTKVLMLLSFIGVYLPNKGTLEWIYNDQGWTKLSDVPFNFANYIFIDNLCAFECKATS